MEGQESAEEVKSDVTPVEGAAPEAEPPEPDISLESIL